MKRLTTIPLIALAILYDFPVIASAACNPKALFSATRICEGSPTNFNDLSSACSGKLITNFTWYFGDGTSAISTEQSPEYLYQEPGIYTASLVVTDSEGITDSVSQEVEVVAFPNRPIKVPLSYTPAPLAKFSFSYVSEGIPATVDFINTSENALSYEWTFGNGESSAQFAPVQEYFYAGNFAVNLVAINEDGCRDTATATVVIEPSVNIFLPSAFTPDEDGTNDVLSVSTENLSSFFITVFNRFGEPVYKSNNPNFAWDGKYQGLTLSSGVYPTIIKATDNTGTNHQIRSKVTIIR